MLNVIRGILNSELDSLCGEFYWIDFSDFIAINLWSAL